MNELEEILELLGEEQLEELKGELFLLLSNCVASQHFQVQACSSAGRCPLLRTAYIARWEPGG